MFVRFRTQRTRLQASLVETRRVAGKVVAKHLGGLGSVDADLSVRERETFWAKLPERLDRIGDWIGPSECEKICAMLDARIPMITTAEQHSILGGEGNAHAPAETHPESREEAPAEDEPTEDEIRVMGGFVGDDPTFASLPHGSKMAVCKGMLRMKEVAQLHDDVAPFYHATKLAKTARQLQKALRVVTDQISDHEAHRDAHLVQALGEMRRRGLEPEPVYLMAGIVVPFLTNLLECSVAVEPRGKLQPPPNRPPKALALVGMMVELLESLDIQVGATGGEGGPAMKVMIRMYAYVSGGEVITADAIKDRLRRLKDWKVAHPDWRTGNQSSRES
jgi:hypothetical protein